MQLSLGVMDLWLACTTADQDKNSRDSTFFNYIQGMQRMVKLNFSEPSVWLWIHVLDVQARNFINFVKLYMLEYKAVYSVYRSFKNEHLNNTKTCTSSAIVYLLVLVKQGDDHASCLRPNMKTEFVVPSNLPYYLDVGRYNKVKYCMYSSKLRMEFYLELMKLFCRAEENF